MSEILIHGDTIRSPELRHEVPVSIPDAFLYAEKGDRRVVILHSLEIARVREDAPQLEIIPLEQLGTDELFAQGKQGWEIELEVALRGCRELGLERVTVPPSFPVAHADHLRANGVEVVVDRDLFNDRRRSKNDTEPVGHNAGSGQIAPNEPIVFDLFPKDKATGCYSDMTRTYVVGEPSDEVKEWHALVKEALESSTAGVRPGVNGRMLFKQVCDQFQEAGYKTQLNKEPGEVLEDGFFHSLGHGVGLEVHELPSMGRNGHDLVPGDVITIEPGLYRSGYGGVRLEDIVVVTKDGHEVLTDYPYDLEP